MARLVQKTATWAAWAALVLIAAVTLSPIELRPVLTGVELEHFFAFGVTGLLFGIAYPRRWLTVVLLLAGAAVLLELAQLVVPGRHGRVVDTVLKTAGGTLGVIVGQEIASFVRTKRSSGRG